jgi:hypothetical protein
MMDGARSRQRSGKGWFVEDGKKVRCFSAEQQNVAYGP